MTSSLSWLDEEFCTNVLGPDPFQSYFQDEQVDASLPTFRRRRSNLQSTPVSVVTILGNPDSGPTESTKQNEVQTISRTSQAADVEPNFEDLDLALAFQLSQVGCSSCHTPNVVLQCANVVSF